MGTNQSISNVVDVLRRTEGSPIVLVCEHASHAIPAELNDLGLSASARLSHAVWDPGALSVAKVMADALDASLVASKISRLVYDCNRPPDAPDAMREKSEAFDVPGNHNLTEAQRAARVREFYTPFETALAAEIERHENPVVVTVHSFTPVYHGQSRDVEIGILHDSDSRFADAILAHADAPKVQRNQPYGPEDGVMHTLRVHALPRRLLNVMIEIRNDLITTEAEQRQMGKQLSTWITMALDSMGVQPCKA